MAGQLRAGHRIDVDNGPTAGVAADDSLGFLLRDRQRRHWLGVPAAVGVALGDRASGVKRTVVATIGDGSFQYSVQAIWTAVQHALPIVFVVMRNEEYSILKAFALLEKCPGVPGMDLPGLDIVSIATGFGCRAVHADTTEQLAEQFTTALTAQGPTVIVVQTQPQMAHLG